MNTANETIEFARRFARAYPTAKQAEDALKAFAMATSRSVLLRWRDKQNQEAPVTAE